LISPEIFAEIICDDLDLNPNSFITGIAQSIRQQLENYPSDTFIEENTDQRVLIKVSNFDLAKTLITNFLTIN
jgi:SWI/SNF-related matrix-associated actin-dependent regulator of chromatin subfamily B protein 1